MKLLLPAVPIRDRLLEAGRWSVLLCLIAVPINKPATNVFLFLALLCAIFGSGTRERFHAAVRHPVALGALAWFAYLLVTALAGPSGPEKWEALSIYRALFYPLIVVALIDSRQWRDRALLAFGASAGLIVLMSIAQFAVALANGTSDLADTGSFTIFKNYTQQGIASLVMASLAAAFAQVEQDKLRKAALWIIAALAVVNVIFALQSRTAYLIVAPLLLYWVWQLFGGGDLRKAVAGTVILVVVAAAAASAPRVQQRLQEAQQDVERYSQQNRATSLGIRIELWKNTLPIIESAPWFGHGLGQWREQYAAVVRPQSGYDPNLLMGHPHQEALLILSELGAVGLAALTILVLALLRYARRLEPPYRDFYTCLVLIYVMAGLANCVLVDFAHRHVFLLMLALIPRPNSTAHGAKGRS